MSDNKNDLVQAPITIPADSGAPKKHFTFSLTQEAGEALEKAGYEKENSASPLLAALQQASGSANRKAPSLAFSENPIPTDNYLGLFKAKRRLLPDEVLKMIRIQDHLVAAILNARSSHLSSYGHLRPDRFSVGIEISIKPEFYKILNPEQFSKVSQRIKHFEQILLNCGHTAGLEQQDKTTLAQFIAVQTKNGLTFGRFATEMIYDLSAEPNEDGIYPFHRFRARDVGTMYKAVRKGESIGDSLRQTAIRLLASMKGEPVNIDLHKLDQDEYAWIQVIDGQPRQAFSHHELLVFNLYDSTDVEHNGYPVSPIDTVVNSITTHISIDQYKKLYFQNGRASKGMLVINSDEMDQQAMDNLNIQYNSAINGVTNSFRTPIFGMGIDDKVQWISTAGEGLGDEFQFMYDQIARNIMSAFSMSPDELPGYSHLSRGTNSQTLSESNNEFKLTAARDNGLRPLILQFQTFFNLRLFPLMDPLLAQICEIKFAGLDAQSKEQESSRLQQDMPVHMTMDEVLHEVGKDAIGTGFGGKFPFNERYQLIQDKFLNASEIKSKFFEDPAAFVDPLLQYKRDPFFLQYIQLLAQVSPSAVQAYFAPKPFAMDFLKMNIQDILEGEENV